MFSVVVILIAFCLNASLGIHKEMCCNDYECILNAVIDRGYPKFVTGLPGVEPTDPLYVDKIVVDHPTVKYSLENPSITGFKDCEFDTLNYTNRGEHTLFNFYLTCPTVTLTSDYEVNGMIEGSAVEGSGYCKIIYEDYHIRISGKHKKVKGNKGKYHLNIINHSIKAIVEGGVMKIQYNNLIFRDNKSYKTRSKLLEETTREAVMDVFMNKYMANLKSFQQHVPIDEVHYKYVA